MKFKISDWLKKIFLYNHDRMLLDQQYKLLITKFEKIKFERNLASDSNIIVSKLNELFRQHQRWTYLSQIELYMVSLFADQEIVLELKIKLLEASEKLEPETVQLFEKEAQNEGTMADKKILLNAIIEKLHISDDILNLEKSYIAKTRIRTSLFFFIAIIMFFAVDQLPAIANLLSIAKGSKGDAILTAMASGWMGTSFSMLLGLRTKLTVSSLQDLKVIHRIDYIFSRAIIGMTSGLLMFYLFQSQIITGSFFPVFSSVPPIVNDISNSLLVIWCFISGFSEKLVPDLIAQTEEKMATK